MHLLARFRSSELHRAALAFGVRDVRELAYLDCPFCVPFPPRLGAELDALLAEVLRAPTRQRYTEIPCSQVRVL